ncbi:MAG: hypothetical protein AAGE89_11600 [Pseudomonadota bacterium]
MRFARLQNLAVQPLAAFLLTLALSPSALAQTAPEAPENAENSENADAFVMPRPAAELEALYLKNRRVERLHTEFGIDYPEMLATANGRFIKISYRHYAAHWQDPKALSEEEARERFSMLQLACHNPLTSMLIRAIRLQNEGAFFQGVQIEMIWGDPASSAGTLSRLFELDKGRCNPWREIDTDTLLANNADDKTIRQNQAKAELSKDYNQLGGLVLQSVRAETAPEKPATLALSYAILVPDNPEGRLKSRADGTAITARLDAICYSAESEAGANALLKTGTADHEGVDFKSIRMDVDLIAIRSDNTIRRERRLTRTYGVTEGTCAPATIEISNDADALKAVVPGGLKNAWADHAVHTLTRGWMLRDEDGILLDAPRDGILRFLNARVTDYVTLPETPRVLVLDYHWQILRAEVGPAPSNQEVDRIIGLINLICAPGKTRPNANVGLRYPPPNSGTSEIDNVHIIVRWKKGNASVYSRVFNSIGRVFPVTDKMCDPESPVYSNRDHLRQFGDEWNELYSPSPEVTVPGDSRLHSPF